MKIKFCLLSELKEDCCRLCNKPHEKDLKELVDARDCFPICDGCMDKLGG